WRFAKTPVLRTFNGRLAQAATPPPINRVWIVSRPFFFARLPAWRWVPRVCPAGAIPFGCAESARFPASPLSFAVCPAGSRAADPCIYRGLARPFFAVNHAHRNTGFAHAITLVGTKNDDDEDERDYQRRSVRVGLVGANDQGR